MKHKVLSTFYWWVIAAAFIGPGTVTTAARAGATYGFDLVWAVLFSIIACIVLQEASARASIVTGKPLAQVMGEELGRWIMLVVALAVGIGCLAYEAGNVTGAASGIVLLNEGLSMPMIVVATSLAASVMLWFGTIQFIARWLGFIVLIMGICFIVAAVVIFKSPELFIEGLFIPTIPDGATLTVVGLVGTTIVPYALFLGSGIAKGRQVPEMRLGTTISVGIGGLITLAILITGTAVSGDFSFINLAEALRSSNGDFFAVAFSLGLFAAGFTSAITAPTAFGIVVESVWPKVSPQAIKWVRVSIVAFGAAVALSDLKPVSIIVAAQALNGILLPLTAITLAIVMTKPGMRTMPFARGVFGNTLLWISVLLSLILGLAAIYRLFL
jgi:Mn2+/Fe2+ NRAMP family transporter